MSNDFVIAGHSVDEMAVGDIGLAIKFDELLQRIDERLRCFWVKPDATSFAYPGRWHVGFFHSNPELRTYFAITNPDGSYCEPGSHHLEAIMARDTWSGQMTYGGIEQTREAKRKTREKRKEELRREFREKLLERIDFMYRPQISVPALPKAMVVEREKTLAVADASGRVTDTIDLETTTTLPSEPAPVSA